MQSTTPSDDHLQVQSFRPLVRDQSTTADWDSQVPTKEQLKTMRISETTRNLWLTFFTIREKEEVTRTPTLS